MCSKGHASSVTRHYLILVLKRRRRTEQEGATQPIHAAEGVTVRSECGRVHVRVPSTPETWSERNPIFCDILHACLIGL